MNNGLLSFLKEHERSAYELHQDHVNPAFVKMLRAIGFDKCYVRGQGCYLWDDEGNKYLDLLTGWGVFALGRNHPKVKAALVEVLSADLPNLVRMECSPLAGVAAMGLALVLLLGLFTAGPLARPLERLADQAKALPAGDVQPVGGGAELDHLDNFQHLPFGFRVRMIRRQDRIVMEDQDSCKIGPFQP